MGGMIGREDAGDAGGGREGIFDLEVQIKDD
jgi:hypothetical protein